MVAAKNSNHPDYILLGTIGFLLALGIVILASVSAPFSQERFGQTFYYLKRQFLLGFLPGIILGILAFKMPLTFLKRIILVLFLINLLLLAMVFLPNFGVEVGGARRWISLGPLTFQPSEFLKISFIIYLAAWLTKDSNLQSEKRKRGLGEGIKLMAFLIIIGIIVAVLFYQPDFSTMALIVAVAILMFFAAKTPIRSTVLIIFFVLACFAALFQLAPYRMDRFKVFLNPEIDPLGIGYQLRQSLIAVGSGGVSGLGLGMSHQKLGFLPHSLADSIFAVFAEETGLIGSLILILLFLIFYWRGIEISKKSSSEFSQLVALGISSWITLQAFWHIGSLIGILPLSGIPWPFISYGASHLVTELCGVGILLNISKEKQ